jgi:hypothetical protein
MDSLISRAAAIEALAEDMPQPYTPDGSHPADEGIFMAQEIYADCIQTLKELPSAQPATSCSEIPNASDVVSRKAVREMVATWSYDMAEWEDMELALHDVDELPPAQPEVIHCKD